MYSLNIGINDFQLPVYINYDSDYYPELKSVLERYELFIEEKFGIDSDTYKKVRINVRSIIEALILYYNGKTHLSFNKIKEMMELYKDSPFFISDIDQSYAFYGSAPYELRPTIHKTPETIGMYNKMLEYEPLFFRARHSEKLLKREDFLHIPFDKREIISTQRFSIPGIPCLYLATTSFGAFMEMAKEDNSQMQIVAYKLPKNIKVLNLCVQQHLINGLSSFIDSDYEKKKVLDAVKIFPLVIATSFKVNQVSNRSFKSEYIIPQLVTQACSELGIEAIAYLSKKLPDNFAYPQAVNIAIIIPYNEELGLRYWDRMREINISNPFKLSCITNEYLHKHKKKQEYKTLLNECFKNNIANQVCVGDMKVSYTDTVYSAFDEFLSSSVFEVPLIEKIH